MKALGFGIHLQRKENKSDRVDNLEVKERQLKKLFAECESQFNSCCKQLSSSIGDNPPFHLFSHFLWTTTRELAGENLWQLPILVQLFHLHCNLSIYRSSHATSRMQATIAKTGSRTKTSSYGEVPGGGCKVECNSTISQEETKKRPSSSVWR